MPPSLSNLLTQDKFEDEQEKRIIILLLYNSETSLSVCVCVWDLTKILPNILGEQDWSWSGLNKIPNLT